MTNILSRLLVYLRKTEKWSRCYAVAKTLLMAVIYVIINAGRHMKDLVLLVDTCATFVYNI